MVIGFGELRRGTSIELDGVPYKVEEYSQQKMQQRAPVYRIKLRNLLSGQLIERSFSGYGIKLNIAEVENRTVQLLYEDDGMYHFMDTESFEQYPLNRDALGDSVNYLIEQAEVELVMFKGKPLSVDLPTTVDLLVTDSPPGLRGDSATGGTKPATLETGLSLQVPLFVNKGDKLKVDTRTGQYVERVG